MQNKDNKSGSNQVRPDLFISDLHLCVSRPEITQVFLDFISKTATHANSLYILGDLFEYWAGDDDLEQHQVLIAAFKALAICGVKLYFMHGNRDFLIGARFCNAAKWRPRANFMAGGLRCGRRVVGCGGVRARCWQWRR